MKKTRNIDIDVAKGMLVIIMLVYHCASVTKATGYLSSAGDIMNHLSFIHYAFIMITGFLCGWYYVPKLASSPSGVRRRLATRALKILVVLISLNVILYSTGIALSLDLLLTEINSAGDIAMNFIINVSGRLVAFEILYYIAVLLLLASLILGRIKIIPMSILILVLLFVSSVCGLTRFLTFGLIGILGGMLANKGYLNRTWRFLERTCGLPVIFFLFLYQVPLYGMWVVIRESTGIILYSIEVIVWSLSFVFFLRPPGTRRVTNTVALLGRYTLLAYIFQMFVIQIGHTLLSKINLHELTYYFGNLSASAVVLCMFIYIFDHLRQRIRAVDSAYGIVFG